MRPVDLTSTIKMLADPEQGVYALSQYFNIAISDNAADNFKKTEINLAQRYSNFFLLIGIMTNYNVEEFRPKSLKFIRANPDDIFSLDEFSLMYSAICEAATKRYDKIDFFAIANILEITPKLNRSIVQRGDEIERTDKWLGIANKIKAVAEKLNKGMQNPSKILVNLEPLKQACLTYAASTVASMDLGELEDLVRRGATPQELALVYKRMSAAANELDRENSVAIVSIDDMIRHAEQGHRVYDLPFPVPAMSQWLTGGEYTTAGFPNYSLVIAGSNVGKSAIGIHFAHAYAHNGLWINGVDTDIKTMIISREEQPHAIYAKLIAMETGKPEREVLNSDDKEYIRLLRAFKNTRAGKCCSVVDGLKDKTFWATAAFIESWVDEQPKDNVPVFIVIDHLMRYRKNLHNDGSYTNHQDISDWLLTFGQKSVLMGKPVHFLLLCQAKNTANIDLKTVDYGNLIGGSYEVYQECEFAFYISKDIKTHQRELIVAKKRIGGGTLFPRPLPYVVHSDKTVQFHYDQI